MARIWTIIANTNVCRIYEYDKPEKELTLVKELLHPSSKSKSQDLVSDKPGRYKKNTQNPRSAYEANMNPHEVEIQRFALQIAHELEAGRNSQQYQELMLIIPAHMSGIITAAMNKNVKACIKETIHKDYLHYSEPDIVDELQEKLRRPKY